MFRRVASALLVGGLLSSSAFGQAAPPPTRPADPAQAQAGASDAARPADEARSFREPIPTDPAHPNYHAAAHRSIMRHNPLPYRTSYQADPAYGGSPSHSGGHFSTGGVGRMAEYYDDRTLNPGPNFHQTPVAQIGNGGVPDRDEQIRAQQVGQQRTANIQNNINAYGRPYGAMGAGFGYGLGLAGGGLYTYPY